MSVCAVAALIHSVLILLEVGCFHEVKANKRETHRKLMRLYMIFGVLESGGVGYQPNWYLFCRLRAVWTREARKRAVAGNEHPAGSLCLTGLNAADLRFGLPATPT